MRPFRVLYKRVLQYSTSRFAVYWLCVISFIESFILPLPLQDVLLASMSLQNRKKAYHYAFFCTLSSVAGAMIGYYLGVYFIDFLLPFIEKFGYLSKLNQAENWFIEYGIWIILIAGFSPVPYKIFTISAGMLSMALLPFILFSLVARAARYFLIAFLVRKFGKRCDAWLNKYIDRLGYVLIVIIAIGLWYVY
ncbi:MAG: YqaA family protein [Gammaproteobacteria bacterium]